MTNTGGEACEIHNPDAPARLLFFCDHASNSVPRELGTLGLPQSDFARHIVFDIGAAHLTRALSNRLGAPAVIGRWSRLVVDLNRGPDDPTLVMKLSDGHIIPGNRDLDRATVAGRIARYHAPYHAAIAKRIAAARADGLTPVLISMHSFTPVWRGYVRPWHIGVLHDRDMRLASALMQRLSRETDIVVGDNEPYTGALENDSLYRHGTMNGLPHVLIEVRQDLIGDEDGIARWAARLEIILRDALAAMGPPTLHFTRPLMAFSGGLPMDEKTRNELEAAAFRRLVAHLRERTDVQNIELMNLAGFCRNCLGDWYREAAAEKGIALEKDAAREIVYGMAPAEWKKRYQKDAGADAQAAFAKSQGAGHKTHS
jgi:predicted N-formylglutamate amidohydrolase